MKKERLNRVAPFFIFSVLMKLVAAPILINAGFLIWKIIFHS